MQIKIRPSPGRQTSGRGENWRELSRCLPLLTTAFSQTVEITQIYEDRGEAQPPTGGS